MRIKRPGITQTSIYDYNWLRDNIWSLTFPPPVKRSTRPWLFFPRHTSDRSNSLALNSGTENYVATQFGKVIDWIGEDLVKIALYSPSIPATGEGIHYTEDWVPMRAISETKVIKIGKSRKCNVRFMPIAPESPTDQVKHPHIHKDLVLLFYMNTNNGTNVNSS